VQNARKDELALLAAVAGLGNDNLLCRYHLDGPSQCAVQVILAPKTGRANNARVAANLNLPASRGASKTQAHELPIAMRDSRDPVDP